jgi:hypothetical protein
MKLNYHNDDKGRCLLIESPYYSSISMGENLLIHQTIQVK